MTELKTEKAILAQPFVSGAINCVECGRVIPLKGGRHIFTLTRFSFMTELALSYGGESYCDAKCEIKHLAEQTEHSR